MDDDDTPSGFSDPGNVRFFDGLQGTFQRSEMNINPPVELIPASQFVSGFRPPDYLVKGVLQKGYLYALTAPPGAGKTALALSLAMTVGSVRAPPVWAGKRTKRGNVLYMGAENADDIRLRLMGWYHQNPSTGRGYIAPDTVTFQTVRRDIRGMLESLIIAAGQSGGFHLVIVDTSPAYFFGEEENSNTAILAHAESLRLLTTLPGNPTVLALCHPTKSAAGPLDLLPRGGGAFLGEIDGNLTLWREVGELTATLHYNKIRGPGFEPVPFKLDAFTVPGLVDTDGDPIPTVGIHAMTGEEAAAYMDQTELNNMAVLVEYAADPRISRRDCAIRLAWLDGKGVPLPSKVERCLERLKNKGFVKLTGGRVKLTSDGKEEAERFDALRN